MAEFENMRGAILQRDKETYAIVLRIPVGFIKPDLLEKISYVAKKYEIPVIKITSAQRIALVGLKPQEVDQVWEELGVDVGPAVELCVHYVQACPGKSLCRYGILDSLGLGTRLEELLVGLELPAKAKIGVSGCPLNCGEAYVRDIGVFAKRSGWTLVFGGNSGTKPRIGDIVAEKLTDEEVVELAQKCLNYYKENAKKKERTGRFVARVGIDKIKEAVL